MLINADQYIQAYIRYLNKQKVCKFKNHFYHNLWKINYPPLQFFQQQIKMSDIDHLVQLIESILQPTDQNLRKKSEDTLTQLRTTHPNQLIMTLLTILQNKNKIQIRNFAATQLRLSLSNFSPSTYTNLWSKLSVQNQNTVKVKLFEIIYKQQDSSMKKHIADALGEIAGSILATDNEAWPDFKKNVWVLLQDTNINSNLSAFNILESFFTYAPSHFKDNANDLYALFKAALGHQNCKLKLGSLRCFQAYLQVLDSKKAVKFEQLVIPIYQAVYLLLVNDNNQQGLQILSEMIDIDAKFFKKKFDELSELMNKIFHIPKLQNGIKRMATELLIDFAEKFPALYRKKKQILNQTIEMVFAHMIDISNKISDEWKSPPQGFSDDMEDDDDFQTTRFGMSSIDRLIFSVGQEEMLPILSDTIQKMLAQEDWRYKYTAVMALSQIGQYIEEPQKISSIIEMIARFLKHDNPMIRYSACHAIGQISDDMQPKFQQKFGDALLPQILQLLGDPIPRVVAHCAAALTNFLEQMQSKQVLPYADKLMEMLIYYGKNGISLVKESCLSAISSVAQVLNEQFVKYFQASMELLFNIFKEHTTKQYKQLKGQSIQTITIIATSVGAQVFQPAAGKLIDLMIALQSSQFEQVDPQKTYLLAGWQRLCMLYGKNLAGKLDQILPTLFQLVENVINNELKFAKDPEIKIQKQDKNEKQQENINTFQTEQAEVAISMLNIFIEKLKELYAPYVERTVKLLCTIIKQHPNEDVKEEACKCLPNLIAAVKISDQKIATQMAKYFMDTLVSTIENQFDNDIIIVQLQSLKSVIEELGLCFLNENELSAFSKKILDLLKKSDEQKQRNANFLKQQDIDDEDKEVIDQEIKVQQEVQVAISELIGVLFKTHKAMTMNLANYLMDNILPKAFEDGQSQIMNKFGIFLIDDLVEFLGFELLSSRWQTFSNSLMKFSQVKSCVIRQASCYGLGVLAQNTPNHIVNQHILKTWLNNLISAANIAKGNQKQKTYGHCRDNSIASIGKILKAHFNTFDNREYIAKWMSMLPLKHDKPQALIQHQFLVDIINSKPNLILGDNLDEKLINIHKVLMLFSEINSFHKITNKDIKEKMKQFLGSLNSDPFFAEHQAKIWQSLSPKQQKQLHDLMK